jgi:hypothetical protein
MSIWGERQCLWETKALKAVDADKRCNRSYTPARGVWESGYQMNRPPTNLAMVEETGRQADADASKEVVKLEYSGILTEQ